MDADEAFSRHFAGLVEGGSAGRIGVRAWGPGPSDPDVAAAAARILGAPVPERVTSVRIRGYPAAVALPQMTTHSCGARPRKSLETGCQFGCGDALSSPALPWSARSLTCCWRECPWIGRVRFSHPCSRVLDRVWERIVRRNQAAPYVPVGPRDRIVRVPAAGQPPVVDPQPATSSAPQPEMDDVDMAAAGAAEDDVAMDGEAAGSAEELEEEDEEIL